MDDNNILDTECPSCGQKRVLKEKDNLHPYPYLICEYCGRESLIIPERASANRSLIIGGNAVGNLIVM